MPFREDLVAGLASLEARLADQLRDTEATRAQIRETQEQLQSIEVPPSPSTSPSVPQTSIEKVALFRSLFRGREDV